VVDAALLDAVRAGRLDSAGRLAASLLRTCGAWPWAVYGSDPGPLLARLAGVEPLLRDAPAAHARVLAALAVGSCYDRDPAVPDGLGARALREAEELADPDVLADALLARALTYSGVAERAGESIAVLDRLAALPHAQAQVDGVLRHSLLTMARFTLGDVDAAVEHVRLGAAGSDLLRLVVSRAQLRWVEGALTQWRADDLARAEELYDHAYDLHRRTELYESNVRSISMVALRWDQGRLGEPDPLQAPGVPDSPADPWIAAVRAAALDDPAADALLAAEVHRDEPVTWTTHGRLTLVAHAVADRGLREHAEALRARLGPLAACVATIGQVGVVGPVGLALARLDLLVGDAAAAAEHLGAAAELAERAGGAGARLRCRLLAARLGIADDDPAGIAREARARGLVGLAEEAARPAGQPVR
jgi:hypothetical protein